MEGSLKNYLLFAVFLFASLSFFIFIWHEASLHDRSKQWGKLDFILSHHHKQHTIPDLTIQASRGQERKPELLIDGSDSRNISVGKIVKCVPPCVIPHAVKMQLVNKSKMADDHHKILDHIRNDENAIAQWKYNQSHNAKEEQRGILICNGKAVDSEIIYWKIIPGDSTFESPITPHHDEHHDRYLTFEYDSGGWNTIRMSLECLVVVAHATGRTLVVPPQQHLYLLGKNFKDKHDKKAHDEMGFEDFFDVDLLRSHRGFHVMRMEEFLEKEGVTGGLHGVLPPENSTKAWGQKLWRYLDQVADVTPEWTNKFVGFPSTSLRDDFNLSRALRDPAVRARFEAYHNNRTMILYNDTLRDTRHIHIPGDGHHRLSQYYYAFAFFADPKMQSFYKRFVRDYMRYKDHIQCAGMELLHAVREDARANSTNNPYGDFYALHIRRGDFEFKNVKLSAADILKNLKHENGSAIIPRNAFVYISTDDPDGLCNGCMVQRRLCTNYTSPKPVGCPEDTSWNAFLQFGWKIRFMRDYLRTGLLADVNPNVYGMVESIVCSRAKIFAGTFFSTFTGYIHRLRGYHGLGELTYYHSPGRVHALQLERSIGFGFIREWRAGWTEEDGSPI